jgi:ABC-2 type transport system permease protein
MLKAIAQFEIKTRLARISTWVYFGLFFCIALVWIAAAGGIVKDASITFGSGKVFVNSPFALAQTVSFLGIFGLIIVATIMGRAVQSDFEYRTHHFLFTTPITKSQYLGGRFLGAFVIVLGIFLSVGIGAFLATLLPGMDADRMGPNRLEAYLWPYVLILLPNVLLIGGVFFMIATLTRKMLPVYIGSILLLVGYLISLNLIRDLDNKTVASMIDPFGTIAMNRVTEYWTVAERNVRLIPLEGVFLWNRMMWLTIAISAVTLCFFRFNFSQFASEKVSRRNEKKRANATALAEETLVAGMPANANTNSRLVISPDDPHGLAMLPRMVWLNFTETIKNVYFGVLVFAGVLFMILASTAFAKQYGTPTWPVTHQVVEIVIGGFGLFMLVIITLYAGEMVWRERDQRIDQIVDAMPVPTWLPITAKLLALMLIPLLLHIFLLLCGIGLQVSKGYYNFELGLYFKSLFGFYLLGSWLTCALAIAIHSLVNNKYLGHFVMVAIYVVLSFSGLMGFEHNLYKFGSIPSEPYSDMNGFGHYVFRDGIFALYWIAAASLLTIAAYLFWTRGTQAGWRERVAVAGRRLSERVWRYIALFAVLFICLGIYIFYNTNVLNVYENTARREQLQADYEKQYKATSTEPQPKVVGVKVNVELFPTTQRARMSGAYQLMNKNSVPVENVRLAFPSVRELKFDKLEFDQAAELVSNNEAMGLRNYKLKTPLAPGGTMSLSFDLSLVTSGFRNSGANTSVVLNGTFINGYQVLPFIGYQDRFELVQDKDRKKFDLEPKERARDRDDPEGLKNNYISNFSDWIDFETVVSTEADQIAIAPGYLQRDWTEGGRRYFEFKMDAPILNFFAFQSARYEIKKDVWKGPNGDISLEIYHHPSHTFNLDSMMASSKASLEYLSNSFGPYQHRQFRIIEFPRYQEFAQAFPNTIPYSEGIGFIARVDPKDEKDIDYPYYITAHEAAHQWWAHQVIGGNVQGATMLSETLAQYSALMIMKKRFGAAKMQKFLTYELDSYLRGRAFEQKKEVPLARVENQGYIHYQKGGLAMYALQDYIGEENLNRAIKAFRDETAYKGPPYPNATMLIKRIREVTPSHLQYVIDDLFESIIIFDNRATKATYKPLANGKFEVTISVTVKKRRSDELGKETDAPLNDWIDIGVLDEKGAPLLIEKRKIEKEETEFVLTIDKKPAKAGIDPLNILIDRRPKDNVINVDKA